MRGWNIWPTRRAFATYLRQIAKDGGVLRRAGHTEAAIDLAGMAGLQRAAVLCEILHDDGTMARLPELMEFRKKHGLRICTIQSLISHRR